MSGGHYDYSYQNINTLADRIDGDIERRAQPNIDSYDGSTIPAERPDILELMRRVAGTLRMASQMAHDVEWYMSGDYGDDTLLECADKWETPQ